MAIVLLVGIGAAVCLAVQLLVHRYWFGLFLSVVATMLAWIVASWVFALATTRMLIEPGPWSALEVILGAALIAQCVAGALAFKRRMMGGQ
jgi:hypothetical protein